MTSAAPHVESSALVDFNALPPSEQQAVAERLLRIQSSGWKPFWCPDAQCDGMPHWKVTVGPLGQEEYTFAGIDDTTGPGGEPLGDRVYEDEAGEWVAYDDFAKVPQEYTEVGRPLLDPQWAHNHAREDQRLLAWNKPWTLFVMSGRGCIAPWTLIELADGTQERVDVLAERGEAVEVMTPDGPRWTDGAPFLKGEAHQWRVRLSTGRVLTVTDKHRFLAPGGWLQLDHVRAGQPLVSAALDQPSTADPSSRGALSGWREDVQRCWSTELGFGCGCPTCRRRGGLPLPPLTGDDRGTAPSPAGATGRSPSLSGSDAPVLSPAGSPSCQRSTPRSRNRFAQVEPSQADGQVRTESGRAGSSPHSPETAAPSHVSTAPQQSTPEGQPQTEAPAVARAFGWLRPLRGVASRLSAVTRRVLGQAPSQSKTPLRSGRSGLVWVEEIEYSHFGPFYDLTVPGPSSYISEGVVNHNSGKTRLGVEFVTLCARKGLTGAILGRRGTELVNTHVAEIIANAHPDFTPVHLASKDILVWPEVTLPDGETVKPITYLFSAERPENIRSVNLSYAWVDEAAFMDEIETAWMNLKLATRVRSPGNPIHFLITSTPTGTPWVMKMEDDPDVTVRRVSTYANRANLDPDFLAALEKEYEGTRMGRQELHGEVLRDVEGAMWNDDMFQHLRLNIDQFEDYVDGLDDAVVAVDPAGSKGKRSDATGIIGVGVHRFDDSGAPLRNEPYSVLARGTIKGTPSEWAERTFKVARLIKARRIIAEKNFGGDMVKQVLKDWAALNPEASKNHEGEEFTIVVRHAVQSKETRAEATVGKYEQKRVTHVTSPTPFGDLSELETQQVTWVPKSRGGRMPSPNDIDALVWGVRELESSVTFKTQTANQNKVRDALKKRGGSSGGRDPMRIPLAPSRSPSHRWAG